MRGSEVQHGVAFLAGFGADEVIADRDALAIGEQHESHAPDELALGGAVAVGRVPSELALRSAARVVGARDQRSVGKPDLALSDQLGEHQLHRRDVRRQPAQPAVVLRLIRQVGKQPRQQPVDRSQKPAIRDRPGHRLRDRERDDLSVCDLPRRSWTRQLERRREHVGCDRQGLQTRAHLVLQSRGCRAGGPVLLSTPHSCPGRSTHIKPLEGGFASSSPETSRAVPRRSPRFGGRRGERRLAAAAAPRPARR